MKVKKRIGFFVNSWIFGDIALERIVKRIAALGYDGIELVGEPKIYKPSKIC